MGIDNVGCPVCGYTGWISTEKGMKRCSCLETAIEEKRYEGLRKRSGLVGALKEKSFSNYEPLNESQRKALKVVKKGGSFFLSGSWGTGKTHLLAASVNASLGEGVQAALISVPMLLEEIRRDIGDKNNGGLFTLACEIPYLALDDLGKERVTDFMNEKIFVLFDVREVHGRRTAVTSNYDLKILFEKDLVDGAVISRIEGLCGRAIIKIEGKDYRVCKKEGSDGITKGCS